ncbi:MAG TPA: prepilin peptidase [Candidatus Limnocylindrales bacterium]|nr:prepilin peptidase [Candidatus Limnocylindrales bacterium]
MAALLIMLFLIGLLVGAAINALADDLPLRQKARLPHYADGAPKPLSAWLGLAAFALGKRVSASGAKLSWRYPAVELGTAALFVLTAITTAERPEIDALQLVFFLIYMALFMLITVIDLEHRLILFVVIIPSYGIALLDALITSFRPDIGQALLGALFGFGIFFLAYLGGYAYVAIMGRLRGEKITEVAFGYGDVMLIALSGLILGIGPLLLTMFITVFLGAGGAILYLAVRRLRGKHTSLLTPLPYGQYIVIATVIMLLFSNQMRSALL